MRERAGSPATAVVGERIGAWVRGYTLSARWILPILFLMGVSIPPLGLHVTSADGAACGRVGTLLSFVALDGHTFVGSTDAGNMVRSTDGGRCWSAARVGQTVGHRMGEMTRDPRRSNVILAGAGNPARIGSPLPAGLLSSIDAGRSWRTLGAGSGLPTTRFSVAALVATQHALFVALTCGDEVTAMLQGRSIRYQCAHPLYRSTDDGRTWRAAALGAVPAIDGAPPFDSSVQALAAGGDGSLYASVSPFVGDAGLYRSTDGGLRWRPSGREDRLRGATALLDTDQPGQVLLAGVGLLTANGQVLRSADGGRTWSVVLDAPALPDPLVLGFVTTHGGIICVGLQHLYRSADAGLTWAPLLGAGLPGGNNSYLRRLPDGSLLLAVTGGLYRSADGDHWKRL